MLREYDFGNAVRGQYHGRYRQGTNVVLLDAGVADVFPNATAVNDALWLLVAVADAMAFRRQERTKGPDKAQPPTSRGRPKVAKATTSKAARA